MAVVAALAGTFDTERRARRWRWLRACYGGAAAARARRRWQQRGERQFLYGVVGTVVLLAPQGSLLSDRPASAPRTGGADAIPHEHWPARAKLAGVRGPDQGSPPRRPGGRRSTGARRDAVVNDRSGMARRQQDRPPSLEDAQQILLYNQAPTLLTR